MSLDWILLTIDCHLNRLVHTNVARLCKKWLVQRPDHGVLDTENMGIFFWPLELNFGELYNLDKSESVEYIEVGRTPGVDAVDKYLFDEHLGRLTKDDIKQIRDVDDFLDKNHIPEDERKKIKNQIHENEETMVREDLAENPDSAASLGEWNGWMLAAAVVGLVFV